MSKMNTIKTSKIPYFFLLITSLPFGLVFTLSYIFLPEKVRSWGGVWVEATYLNCLPFLIVGLMSMIVFIFNLIHTYWMTANRDGLIIRNLFKKRKIPWSEIKEISPPKWINFPISKVITFNEKSYYIHFLSERLNHLKTKNK